MTWTLKNLRSSGWKCGRVKGQRSNAYSKEARTWATEIGLIAGGGIGKDGNPNYMWEDLLTREQFVTVLYRFAQLIGKV